MADLKQDMRRVQEIAHATYLATGSVLAALDGSAVNPRTFANALDKTAEQMEAATVELRNLCEKHRPSVETPFNKRRLPHSDVSGRVNVTEMNWLHIELNALLPPCNKETPRYLTDTIVRLLDDYEAFWGFFPWFDSALLVIDEHCDIDNRRIFDQDNKGWKAVSNALKGKLFADDDQFTLGVALISTRSDTPRCNIYLLPVSEADDFFYMREAGHPIL